MKNEFPIENMHAEVKAAKDLDAAEQGFTPNLYVDMYQCPGCVSRCGTRDCGKYLASEEGCLNHVAGTLVMGVGPIALGLPRGFNRFGHSPRRRIEVFSSYDVMLRLRPHSTTIFSLPVWKYLDLSGNTVMRWYSPRTNAGWTVIIIGDCMDKFPNCQVITQSNIDNDID